MNNSQFYLWVFFVSIQIIVFSIYTYKMFFNKDDDEISELISIVIYENNTYWKENGNLFRAPYSKNKTNMKKKEITDVLTHDTWWDAVTCVAKGLCHEVI